MIIFLTSRSFALTWHFWQYIIHCLDFKLFFLETFWTFELILYFVPEKFISQVLGGLIPLFIVCAASCSWWLIFFYALGNYESFLAVFWGKSVKPELMVQSSKEDLHLLLPGTPVHPPPINTLSELNSFRFPVPHKEYNMEPYTQVAIHTVCYRTALQPIPVLIDLCLCPI